MTHGQRETDILAPPLAPSRKAESEGLLCIEYDPPLGSHGSNAH